MNVRFLTPYHIGDYFGWNALQLTPPQYTQARVEAFHLNRDGIWVVIKEKGSTQCEAIKLSEWLQLLSPHVESLPTQSITISTHYKAQWKHRQSQIIYEVTKVLLNGQGTYITLYPVPYGAKAIQCSLADLHASFEKETTTKNLC